MSNRGSDLRSRAGGPRSGPGATPYPAYDANAALGTLTGEPSYVSADGSKTGQWGPEGPPIGAAIVPAPIVALPPTTGQLVDVKLHTRRPANFYLWVCAAALLMLCTLAAMCVLTGLMWMQIHNLQDSLSKGDNVQTTYMAGAPVGTGQVLSTFIDGKVYPGIGLQYATPMAVVTPQSPGIQTVAADSQGNNIAVVTSSPGLNTYGLATAAYSGQWGAAPSSTQIPVAGLQQVLGANLLPNGQAVVWYSAVTNLTAALMADCLQISATGVATVTQTFTVASGLPATDPIRATASTVSQGNVGGAFFAWGAPSSPLCGLSVLTWDPTAGIQMATGPSNITCYSATASSLTSTPFGTSVVIAGGPAISLVPLSLGAGPATTTPSQSLPMVDPTHSLLSVRMLQYAGQLFVASTSGSQLAVWSATVTASGVQALVLQQVIRRSVALSVLSIYSAAGDGSVRDPQGSGLFILFREAGSALHLAVRVVIQSGAVMVSDVVQGHPPGPATPVQTLLVGPGPTPMTVFAGQPIQLAPTSWTGGLAVAGIALTNSSSGSKVTVQLLGTVPLPSSAVPLVPGLLYYTLATGSLTNNQYQSSPPSDRPVGLALAASSLRLCRLRYDQVGGANAC